MSENNFSVSFGVNGRKSCSLSDSHHETNQRKQTNLQKVSTENQGEYCCCTAKTVWQVSTGDRGANHHMDMTAHPQRPHQSKTMRLAQITNLKLMDLFYDFMFESIYATVWVQKIKPHPSVSSSLPSRRCLSERKSHFCLPVCLSGFGSGDGLPCQPALPHITRAKTLRSGCATNLRSRLKQKKITTLPGRDPTPPLCSLTVFLVYPLICVC